MNDLSWLMAVCAIACRKNRTGAAATMTTETNLPVLSEDPTGRRSGERRGSEDRRRRVHGLFDARFFAVDEDDGRRRSQRRGSERSLLDWLLRRPSSGNS